MKRTMLRGATIGAVIAATAVAYAATFPADGAWLPLLQAGTGVADPDTDGQNNGREIVGTPTDPAVYVYVDAADFFVRLRLDDDPRMGAELRPYGWGLLIDTDGNLLDYEFSLMVNGIANPEVIELAENTTKTGVGDPSDEAETLREEYPVDMAAGGNVRVVDAATTIGGTPDYFLDFAVPIADLATWGISLNSPLTFWAGTSNNARSITVDLSGTALGPGPGGLEDAASDPIILGDDPVDDDNDGITSDQEIANGTDPYDADSDDDGVADGDEPSWNEDTDGDGLVNALDPDSDNDGLRDGTELGLDCGHEDTDTTTGNCVPDADSGDTTTDPLAADTDGGGASDGSEDANLDGAIDAGETDPTTGHGDDDSTVVDTDGDGLGDELEEFLGLDPNDADTDDDGLLDGQEPNPSLDTDGDGLLNGSDVDSDNDALYDGTESGVDCADEDTDTAAGHCIPDGDAGDTVTSPLLPDTDGGGVPDGSEDADLDGVVDNDETDPTDGHGSDDGEVVDTDGDGLGDELETTLGSDPADADSDDDGVPDGLEPNPADDQDGDGVANILDEDSDGDGLFDGTEMGRDCPNPPTDPTAEHCIPDGDAGATTTNPLLADTDGGGLDDGEEDLDHDGVQDDGERDPNNPIDDVPCDSDSDCGAVDSGMVCDIDDLGFCIEGCRGSGGNGCPEGELCTSTDESIGECVPTGTGGGGTGGGGTGGAGATGGSGVGASGNPSTPDGEVWAEGAGFCAARAGRSGAVDGVWLLSLAGLAGLARARRRPQRRAR